MAPNLLYHSYRNIICNDPAAGAAEQEKIAEVKGMQHGMKASLACAVALMVLAGTVSFGHGGGVINWKTRVTNPTEYPIRVYMDYDIGGRQEKTLIMDPGSSVTFETGALCPYKLRGQVYRALGMNKDILDMAPKCINGLVDVCTVICADSSWKITQHSDGAYHFDRD